MLGSFCVKPPIETVNPGSRLRKMIRLAAVSADVQIVIRWGVAAERQILGDLWPHIIVEIGTREQLLSVPIPPIKPEPRDAGEVANRSRHPQILLRKGKPVLQLKRTEPLRIVKDRF